MDTARRGWALLSKHVLRRILDPPEEQGSIIGGNVRKGQNHLKRAGFPVSVPRQQDTAYRSYSGRYKSPLPSWAPDANIGCGCCYKTQELMPNTALTVLGVHKHQLPLGVPDSKPCYPCPRSAQGAATPTKLLSRCKALLPLTWEWVGCSHQ